MLELLKLLLELGPLMIFFITNGLVGIYWATGIFMATTAAALLASRFVLNRLPIMLMVSGVLVMVFGGLTIWLHNDIFVKIKPTIVNLLFASVLLFGVMTGRMFIKMLLGEALHLTDIGWRKLQLRYGFFFVFLAGLNEVVWRGANWYWWNIPRLENVPHPADNFWAGFKVFGVWPMAVAFMMLQLWLIRDQMIPQPEKSAPQAPAE